MVRALGARGTLAHRAHGEKVERVHEVLDEHLRLDPRGSLPVPGEDGGKEDHREPVEACGNELERKLAGRDEDTDEAQSGRARRRGAARQREPVLVDICAAMAT